MDFFKSAVSTPPLLFSCISSSDHRFPSELFQQLTGFQPISKGKHSKQVSWLNALHLLGSKYQLIPQSIVIQKGPAGSGLCQEREGVPLKWQAISKTQLVEEGNKA